MAITFVGENDAAAAVCNLPAFNADDIAVVFAFRDGSTTAPSLPAGWTSIDTAGANTCSFRCGYRQLVGTDTTTSTWTNATEIEVVVLRGVDLGLLTTLFNSRGSGSSTSMNWPAIASGSFQDKNGRAWVALLGGHRSATDCNSTALTGSTQRGGATGALAAHTAEGVTSWSSTSKTVNANSGWFTVAVEIPAAGEHDRVTQAAVEHATAPTSQKGRVTQAAVEHATAPSPKGRVTQAAVEYVSVASNVAVLTQAAVEVLIQRTHRSRNRGTIIG